MREGRFLAQSSACTAALDVSDGLSSDLGHICRESGVGAVIRQENLPASPALLHAAAAMGKDPLDWILHGGEDYVLLATVNPDSLEDLLRAASQEHISLIPIGEITDTGTMGLLCPDGAARILASGGWDHFR